VERRRRTDDERSVEITLTEAGRGLKTQVGEIPQVIVDAYNLDADDFASLRTTLRELAESVAASPESEASD
jgi:DNA-binding MarR family transcriptional regulator